MADHSVKDEEEAVEFKQLSSTDFLKHAEQIVSFEWSSKKAGKKKAKHEVSSLERLALDVVSEQDQPILEELEADLDPVIKLFKRGPEQT